MGRIIVAMSGGVDSSVAAALLKSRGHDVAGATMRLSKESEGAIRQAKIMAGALGIPHQVIDLTSTFEEEVIAPFCRDYASGLTPNPCVRCNRRIKFGALLDSARQTGAEYLATGHYARIEKDNGAGRYLLKKGLDAAKDQSYFLSALTQEQLGCAMFPLGEMKKTETRKIAREMNLPVPEGGESQEICFIPGDDYAAFLEERLSESAAGPIVNREGSVLGEHRGIFYYTVGQRRGLGISSPAPLYVTAISAAENKVIVGGKEETYSTELTAGEVNWIALPGMSETMEIKARIRYRHPEAEATLRPYGLDRVQVRFHKPQMAVAPGQAVVFYHADSVIGSGIIQPGEE